MIKNKKLTIIFGASKGIGLAIFKKISKNCNDYIITFSRSKKIVSNKSNYKHFVGDILKENSLSELLSFIKKNKLKAVNIIICIGDSKSQNTGYENFKDIDYMFQINFFSQLKIIYNFIPYMKKKSKIICVSSIASDSRLNSPIGYSCAKSALNNFIKNFSKSYKDRKISICGILPGHTMHASSVWKKKVLKDKHKTYKFIKQASSNSKFVSSSQIADVVFHVKKIENEILNGSLINCENGVTTN
tara:strand:- start:321 stop:1055 length:735 start_codon:yes stop_codon:yes gene_type:complete